MIEHRDNEESPSILQPSSGRLLMIGLHTPPLDPGLRRDDNALLRWNWFVKEGWFL